jgi:hypothetical protein
MIPTPKTIEFVEATCATMGYDHFKNWLPGGKSEKCGFGAMIAYAMGQERALTIAKDENAHRWEERTQMLATIEAQNAALDALEKRAAVLEEGLRNMIALCEDSFTSAFEEVSVEGRKAMKAVGIEAQKYGPFITEHRRQKIEAALDAV